MGYHSFELMVLDLSECGCLSHDRRLGKVRLAAESLVLQKCIQFNEANPGQTLKILSLGTGKGLQDFLLIWKLLQKGINDLEINLVEQDYDLLLSSKDSSEAEELISELRENKGLTARYYSRSLPFYSIINAISLLSRTYEQSKISLSLYSSMADFLKEQKQIDAAYAIDFNLFDESKIAKKDFFSIADALAGDGLAVLSCHYKIQTFIQQSGIGNNSLIEQKNLKFDSLRPNDKGESPTMNSYSTFTMV